MFDFLVRVMRPAASRPRPDKMDYKSGYERLRRRQVELYDDLSAANREKYRLQMKINRLETQLEAFKPLPDPPKSETSES